LALWAAAALGSGAPGHEIAVQLVSPAVSRRLNRQFRGEDKATNVLSFPAVPMPGVRPKPLGDLVICPPVLLREALQQGKSQRAHWAHLVVHGTLHLVGFDHEIEADALRMERREVRVLRGLGFPDPYRIVAPVTRRRSRA
jgi:probable rRNA maturation factor